MRKVKEARSLERLIFIPPGGINTCSFTGMVIAKKHLAFQCYFDGEADPDNFNGFIYPDRHLAGTVTMKNSIGVASWNVS